MRKLALVVTVVIALLAAWWFATRADDGAEVSAAEAAAAMSTTAAPEAPLDAHLASAAGAESQREVAVTELATTGPAALVEERGNVFGVVADEAGTPLEGVVVRLSAYQSWSKDVPGPVLDGNERTRGWEVESVADGSFRLTVAPPEPTAVQALSVTPDPYHDSAIVRFGRDGQPALQPGDRDLGTLRLAATGAIAGHARDAAGHPLAEARARIGSSRSTTYGREGSSDADGRYMIAHIKPGTYGVNVEHEGHVSEFRTSIEVLASRTTEGVDFALPAAPTLRGRVIDVDGVPLEGVRVWGWPRSSGAGAGATSAADGSFTIYLPQDEPYRLEASFGRGDSRSSALGDPDLDYAPNTDGIELVLPRTSWVTVAVLDGATGARVERFGLRVERGEDPDHPRPRRSFSLSPPQPSAQPGGEVRVRVRPGIDAYTVVATGYEGVEGEFSVEDSADGRIEVRLGQGASIAGRALVNGQPAQGVTATLEAGNMRADPTDPSGAPRFAPDSYRALQSLRTAADGRFRFHGVLPFEDHRLSLRAASGESLVRVPLRATQGPIELGDLELLAPGAIIGTVLVPPGRSNAGLLVRLGDRNRGVQRTTDTSGAFGFEGLAAGSHTLFVDEAPGHIVGGGPFTVELAPGAVERVELDLRDKGTCQVSLTVRFSDGPAVGYAVELRPESKAPRAHALGTVGADGRAAGWAPAFGRARVSIRAPDGTVWRHPDAVLELALDARIDEHLVFEVSGVTLVLPTTFSLPSHASVTLELTAMDSGAVFAKHFAPGQLAGDSDVRLDSQRMVFTRVPAGEHELVLRVFDLDQPPVREETSANSWRVRTVPQFERRARVTLAPGRVTELKD